MNDEHNPGRVRAGRAAAALALLALAGCSVSERRDLVGRYRLEGGSGAQEWVLNDDGTCVADVGGPASRCEWTWAETDGRWRVRLVVERDLAGRVDRSRYVLTPSRWPGGAVTLPVGRATLRRID